MKQRVHRHEVIQPLDPSYKLIPLTQGQNAIVDAENYEWLNERNWNARWNNNTKSFYAVAWSNVRMHRLILGCQPGERGDHENRNTLDNRKNNLRKCTESQNSANRIRHKAGKSGFRGVYPSGTKWQAYVGYKGKLIYLGIFDIREDAAKARDEATIELHGEFAVLNFPGGSHV